MNETLIFWERVSHILGWPQFHCEAEDGIGLLILLPPPLECPDGRREAPSMIIFKVGLGIKPQVSFMLGQDFTNVLYPQLES